jgi:hypothetical protein
MLAPIAQRIIRFVSAETDYCKGVAMNGWTRIRYELTAEAMGMKQRSTVFK